MQYAGIVEIRDAQDREKATTARSRFPALLRLETIDCLRGIASLVVCWFHLTNGNSNFLAGGGFQSALKLSGYYGWLGVEVFFVISGFIIPWALWRANYKVAQYGRFLLKRIVRVDPPYFASIAIAVGLAYVSLVMPGFRGVAPDFSLAQLAAHVGYASGILGYGWIIDVYWTLAIEFQYYLAIGLLFPLLVSRRLSSAIVLCALFYGSLTLVSSAIFLFHWLFLFSLGLVTFKFKADLLSTRAYLIALAAVTCLCVMTTTPLIAGVGLATALTIAFGRNIEQAPGIFRKYLVFPVSDSCPNWNARGGILGSRFDLSTHAKVAVLTLAFALSVAGAYLLYRTVEVPARRWSSKLRYSPIVLSMKPQQ